MPTATPDCLRLAERLPIRYEWAFNEQTTAGGPDWVPEVIALTVTDANGCTTTSSVVVNQPSNRAHLRARRSTCGSANGSASVVCFRRNRTASVYLVTWRTNDVDDQRYCWRRLFRCYHRCARMPVSDAAGYRTSADRPFPVAGLYEMSPQRWCQWIPHRST